MSSCGQPPQPKDVVQLPVPAYLTGRPRGRPVVLAQELVMEPHGKPAQDLDRVVGIELVHRPSFLTPQATSACRQSLAPRQVSDRVSRL